MFSHYVHFKVYISSSQRLIVFVYNIYLFICLNPHEWGNIQALIQYSNYWVDNHEHSIRIQYNYQPTIERQLLDYIQRTWIYSNVWPPEAWSQFQRSVRTNNDCEGWHRRLNNKIHRHSLPFYQLLAVLHSEAELVDTQAQFLADHKLRRIQCKKSKTDQGKIL